MEYNLSYETINITPKFNSWNDIIETYHDVTL